MNHRGLCGKFILKNLKEGEYLGGKINPEVPNFYYATFFSQHKPRRSTSHRYITSSLHLHVESMYTQNSKYLPLATFHSIVKLLLTIPQSVLRAFSYHLTASPTPMAMSVCRKEKHMFVASAKRFRLSLAPNQFRFHK